MPENIILFGAGASHGSDSKGTPPLVNNLLGELRKFNPPGWGQLPSVYITDLQNDFELGIIRIAKEKPHDLPILQRAMAAYFFEFRPINTNLYYQLAQKIKRHNWNGAIVTLNYERLLELSLLTTGLQPVIGIPSNAQIELNLPHGCCHLFCESVRGVANAVSLAAMGVQINGEIKVIGNANEFHQRITNDAFPPVMSYFEPQKRATSGQQFLEGQRDRFEKLIENAKRVIAIGIKIRPHDTHIWNAIANTNADFIYCSGLNERNNFDQWVNQFRNGKNNISLKGYWLDKFEEISSIVGL
ncbi:MAG: hypothetical protein NTW93_07310 [Phycisphaerae bacterium]|nr:hypothetical protein [Phycisphaerae bacterium]